MGLLFADAGFAAGIDQREVMEQLWALAVNEQDTRTGITFYDLFTPEELFAVWECVNYRFYNYRGPGPLNRGYAGIMRRRCSKTSSPAPTAHSQRARLRPTFGSGTTATSCRWSA